MSELTERQAEVARFVRDHWGRVGYGPSCQDIARHLRVSRQRAAKYVRRLVRLGVLRQTPGHFRSTRCKAESDEEWRQTLATIRQEQIAARERKHSHDEESGYVYFLESPDRIKIGWSRSPKQRLKVHRQSALCEIRLLGVIRGGTAMERRYHKLWEAQRISGQQEQFKKTLELLAWIDRICNPSGGCQRATLASLKNKDTIRP